MRVRLLFAFLLQAVRSRGLVVSAVETTGLHLLVAGRGGSSDP